MSKKSPERTALLTDTDASPPQKSRKRCYISVGLALVVAVIVTLSLVFIVFTADEDTGAQSSGDVPTADRPNIIFIVMIVTLHSNGCVLCF